MNLNKPTLTLGSPRSPKLTQDFTRYSKQHSDFSLTFVSVSEKNYYSKLFFDLVRKQNVNFYYVKGEREEELHSCKSSETTYANQVAMKKNLPKRNRELEI